MIKDFREANAFKTMSYWAPRHVNSQLALNYEIETTKCERAGRAGRAGTSGPPTWPRARLVPRHHQRPAQCLLRSVSVSSRQDFKIKQHCVSTMFLDEESYQKFVTYPYFFCRYHIAIRCVAVTLTIFNIWKYVWAFALLKLNINPDETLSFYNLIMAKNDSKILVKCPESLL